MCASPVRRASRRVARRDVTRNPSNSVKPRDVESHRRYVDETGQAEPAAPSADRCGGWWKPAGRSEGVRARNRPTETRRAAGPLQRAVVFRKGSTVATRVEDAGGGEARQNSSELNCAPTPPTIHRMLELLIVVVRALALAT